MVHSSAWIQETYSTTGFDLEATPSSEHDGQGYTHWLLPIHEAFFWILLEKIPCGNSWKKSLSLANVMSESSFKARKLQTSSILRRINSSLLQWIKFVKIVKHALSLTANFTWTQSCRLRTRIFRFWPIPSGWDLLAMWLAFLLYAWGNQDIFPDLFNTEKGSQSMCDKISCW